MEEEGKGEKGGAARALAVLTHLREGLFPPDDVGVTGLGSRHPGAVVEATFPTAQTSGLSASP